MSSGIIPKEPSQTGKQYATPQLSDSLIVILLDAGLIGVASFVAGRDRANLFFSLTTLFRFAIILPVAFFLARRFWGHDRTKLGVRLPNRAEWWVATKISFFSLLGYLVVGAVAFFALKPNAEGIIISSNYWFREMNMFYIFASVIQAPVVEEVVFRGLLHSSMSTKFSASKRIVISAFIFAAAHMVWLGQVFFPVTQLMGGFVFAWSFERTKSVLPGMILHAIGNGALCIYHYVNTVHPHIIRAILG